MVVLLVICIVGIAILVQNRYYKKHMFDHLTYTCGFSKEEVYEGDEIYFTEEIVNNKWLPVPWMRSDFTTSSYLDFAESRSVITDKMRYVVSFFLLKGHQSITRNWKVVCKKRGIYSIDNVALVGAGLLGGSLINSSYAANITLTVLPNPAVYCDIPINLRHLSGETVVKRHIVSDPFCIEGIREYTENDSLNKINWKATAKTQKLMVRENGYTTSPSAAIILNIQSRAHEWTKVVDENETENAIRLCASVLANALKEGISTELYSNTSVFERDTVKTEKGFGWEHTLNILRILSALELKKSIEFDDYINTECNNIDASDIYVITSYVNDEIAEFAYQNGNVHILLSGKDCDEKYFSYCDITDLSDIMKSAGGAA